MKKLAVSALFNFGYQSGSLRDLRAGVSVKRVKILAKDWVEGLIENDFKISERIYIEELTPLLEELSDDDGAVLNAAQANNIAAAVKLILKVTSAEIKDMHVFTFAKRRYSYEKLNDKIDEIFAKDIYSKIPESAQIDFAESGKCILVDRPTAAAFHSLRAVESVLRAFHDKKCTNPASANATWGNMEYGLNQILNPSVDTAIMGQLELIRKRYRNQTQHPKLVYDIEEAQDLLNVCIELTNKMAEDF